MNKKNIFSVFTTKLILTELESETSISETISYKLLQWFSFPISTSF